MRLGFFRLLKWNPHWLKRLSGTVIVTSVGMFGRGGGWGLGFLPLHTLGVLVGGIASKPAVHEGEIVIREFLNLTVSFDHDIVDGAPAARFVRSPGRSCRRGFGTGRSVSQPGGSRSGAGILSLSKGACGASWARAARFDELSML